MEPPSGIKQRRISAFGAIPDFTERSLGRSHLSRITFQLDQSKLARLGQIASVDTELRLMRMLDVAQRMPRK